MYIHILQWIEQVMEEVTFIVSGLIITPPSPNKRKFQISLITKRTFDYQLINFKWQNIKSSHINSTLKQSFIGGVRIGLLEKFILLK